jgi:hypothetical protein
MQMQEISKIAKFKRACLLFFNRPLWKYVGGKDVGMGFLQTQEKKN